MRERVKKKRWIVRIGDEESRKIRHAVAWGLSGLVAFYFATTFWTRWLESRSWLQEVPRPPIPWVHSGFDVFWVALGVGAALFLVFAGFALALWATRSKAVE